MNCNDKNSNFVSAYSFPIFSKLSTMSKDSKCRGKNMQHNSWSSEKAVKKQKSTFRKAVIFTTPKVFTYLE